MARVVATRYTNGPLKFVFEMNDDLAKLLGKASRNRLVKYALDKSARGWRSKYLMLRAGRAVLGPPWNYADDLLSPMWRTGVLRRLIMTGRVMTTGTAGRERSKISIPFGHPVTPEIARVFRILPPSEVQWVADTTAQLIVDERKALDTTTKGRQTLSADQRVRFGVKARKTYTRSR